MKRKFLILILIFLSLSLSTVLIEFSSLKEAKAAPQWYATFTYNGLIYAFSHNYRQTDWNTVIPGFPNTVNASPAGNTGDKGQSWCDNTLITGGEDNNYDDWFLPNYDELGAGQSYEGSNPWNLPGSDPKLWSSSTHDLPGRYHRAFARAEGSNYILDKVDVEYARCVRVVSPTLSVDLKVATDSTNWQDSLSGIDSLMGVDLQATVPGTATGTINYKLWCNCPYGATDLAEAISLCGDPNWPEEGSGDNQLTKDNLCNYTVEGTYYAKVLVQRDDAPDAQDQATITIEVCECSTGDCCDGCHFRPATHECRPSAGICDIAEYCTGLRKDCPSNSFRPSSYVCNEHYQTDYGCPWETETRCGDDVGVRYKKRYCSGSSAFCDGSISNWGSWSVHDVCSSLQTCADNDSTCNEDPDCGGPEPQGNNCAMKDVPEPGGWVSLPNITLKWHECPPETCPSEDGTRYTVWVYRTPEMDVQYKCLHGRGTTEVVIDNSFTDHFPLEEGEHYRWIAKYNPAICLGPRDWVDCEPESWSFTVSKCGDGLIRGDEKCDIGPPPNLGGETCESQLGPGYTGDLDCSSDCLSFDVSQCVPPPCAPDGTCNEICPPGCTAADVDDDPDCGCKDDDDCCGIGCTFANDPDCEAAPPPSEPSLEPCDCDEGKPCSPPCRDNEECICDPNPHDGKEEGKCQLKCTGICFRNPLKRCRLEQLIDSIINFFFWVSFAIAPLLLILAGFYWFTAAGDAAKVDRAKKIILWTCAGLAIMGLAKVIIAVVKHLLEW